MRAVDAMIVWTPNRGVWKGKPTAGQIAVTPIPEARTLKAHPMSVGACDLDWRETDDVGRRELMQVYFSEMVHRDHLDEQTVRSALDQIIEFRGYHFSAEKPEDDE